MPNQLLFFSAAVLSAVSIIIVVSFGLVWWFISQPTFSHNTYSKKTVDVQRLRQTIQVLSEDYNPRNYQNVTNLNKSAAYIKDHFEKAGASSISYQRYSIQGNEYVNVIAIFGSNNKERLIIGAHYDSFGNTPGADDNASGVAGLIELAYLFGKYPVSESVELVAYTLEEPPFFGTQFMGSAHHAKTLVEQEISVSLMICLEMIGYYTDQPGSQGFPYKILRLFYPDRGDFLAVVGRLDQRRYIKQIKGFMKGSTDLPIYSISVPSAVPGIDFSDHRNYWHHNLPAVMITDTAFYRNKAYHETGDTIDRLNFKKMAQAVISVYEAVYNFQEANRR